MFVIAINSVQSRGALLFLLLLEVISICVPKVAALLLATDGAQESK